MLHGLLTKRMYSTAKDRSQTRGCSSPSRLYFALILFVHASGAGDKVEGAGRDAGRAGEDAIDALVSNMAFDSRS